MEVDLIVGRLIILLLEFSRERQACYAAKDLKLQVNMGKERTREEREKQSGNCKEGNCSTQAYIVARTIQIDAQQLAPQQRKYPSLEVNRIIGRSVTLLEVDHIVGGRSHCWWR